MIALTDGPPTDGENRCLAELAASLGARTGLVSRFDLEAADANLLEPFRHFVLSSDSLCVHGADSMTQPVQTMERLVLVWLVTPDPATMLPDYLGWVEDLASADYAERHFASRIIGKDLLKVLRGVLLLRGGPYEVAIPRIAARLPHAVPEAAGVAEQLFALYAEPTTDLDAVRSVAAEAANVLQRCPELARLRGAEGLRSRLREVRWRNGMGPSVLRESGQADGCHDLVGRRADVPGESCLCASPGASASREPGCDLAIPRQVDPTPPR